MKRDIANAFLTFLSSVTTQTVGLELEREPFRSKSVGLHSIVDLLIHIFIFAIYIYLIDFGSF